MNFTLLDLENVYKREKITENVKKK